MNDAPDLPEIDYDAVEEQARQWARVAMDRCWVGDPREPQRGHWSDEVREDFAQWAQELTGEYLQQSHLLVHPHDWRKVMADPQHARYLQLIMRGRHRAIATCFRRACFRELRAAFFEYVSWSGRIPRTTLPPAPASLPERRKEAR